MIDTVKFRIYPTEAQLNHIRDKVAVLEKTKEHKTIFRYQNEKIELPSSERYVHVQVKDDGRVFLTLSLPKSINLQNIDLLYPHNVPFALNNLYVDLINYFGDFPHFKEWYLQRLDLCYAWKLPSQESVAQVMSLLRSLEYPRKRPYIRDTSIMFIGSAYTVKFYQKYEEFYQNDYKELSKDFPEMAHSLLKKAEGVIRFEAGLKRRQVEQEFEGKPKYNALLNSEKIYELLNKYFSKYFGSLATTFEDEKSVYDKLTRKHGLTRGTQLFQFYQTYYGDSKLTKQLVIKGYSRAQVYKNRRDIKEAGVGLLSEGESLDFDFKIPSEHVVNEDEWERNHPSNAAA